MTAPSRQNELEPDSQVVRVLQDARAGRAVTLTVYSVTGGLSLQSMNAAVLRKEANAAIVAPILRDQNDISLTQHPVSDYCVHEQNWILAGQLYEQLIGGAEEFTHVFFLDPWCAQLKLPNGPLSKAKRIWLSDLETRRHGLNGEYWAEIDNWVNQAGFECVLPSRSLMPMLAGSYWNTQSISAVPLADLTDQAPEGFVLIDDGWIPTEWGRLNAILAAHSSAFTVLLTRFASVYRATTSELDRLCSVVLDPEHISSSVYLSLLKSAGQYLALQDAPYGMHPLKCAREDKDITLNTAEQVRVERKPNQQAVEFTAPPGNAATGFENWWKSIGSEAAEQPKPEREVLCKNYQWDISILTCCRKYLQRFRVFLDSIARQTYPVERIEICVALPGNPDGVFEYLAAFSIAHPKLTVKAISVPPEIFANRGKQINVAFEHSSSPVVMVADCDLVLAPTFVASALQDFDTKQIAGCLRTPLNDEITANIVTGNLDAVAHYDVLREQWDGSQRDVRQGVLGYCQIVDRQKFESVRYPEEFNTINQSDIVFIERMQAAHGVIPHLSQTLSVLHLSHPRNWSGTEVFL